MFGGSDDGVDDSEDQDGEKRKKSPSQKDFYFISGVPTIEGGKIWQGNKNQTTRLIFQIILSGSFL